MYVVKQGGRGGGGMVVRKEKNEDWAGVQERMEEIKYIMDDGGKGKGPSRYGEEGERWSRRYRDNNSGKPNAK